MNTTNILITGANGQLGHEMRNVLNGDMRFNAVFTDVAGDDILPLDITDEDAVERMVSDNKLAQGCLNALKQPENGGYVDRPVDSGEQKVTLVIGGVGGEAAAK